MAVGSTVAMKVISIAISIPVGIATKKIVGKAWLTAYPEDPPRKPTQPGVQWPDAIAWAALTATSVVARDMITRRTSEAAFRAITGLEPPPPKKTRAEKKLEKAADKIDLDEIGDDKHTGTASRTKNELKKAAKEKAKAGEARARKAKAKAKR